MAPSIIPRSIREYVTGWGSRVVSRRFWRDVRLVRRGQRVDGVPRRRRRRDEVWVIAMVKNEADIIEAFVRHAFSQGCDRMLIMDNGSTDATLAILECLATQFPIHVGRDSEPRYLQDVKMSRLAALARRGGAGWVIPMDADEFWFAPGGTVADFVRSGRADRYRAFMYNGFPSAGTPQIEGPGPGLRVNREADRTLSKQCARTFPGLWIGMGNHWIAIPGLLEDGLRVLHLPWRSFQQYVGKVSVGAAALADARRPEEIGSHWRDQASLQRDELRQRWRALLDGADVPGLGWAPNPHAVIVDATSWRTWEDAMKALGIEG
ncbi:glycosyltransferase family 2 protein [Tessaracoccus palaemonis]|uniref:Glycosyltransferase family 2 protein n=1 Tax=Tessaracoccus palaemonis TaxID=2829499 RepID=A0ABX8SHV0_9ACTN|nr:glycosyltransferase family 2 protein [Tessaracoccus palaemonis]QXT62961.1 glycosyltransferase family 2 protein [Tessaracoccus palaemonis]